MRKRVRKHEISKDSDSEVSSPVSILEPVMGPSGKTYWLTRVLILRLLCFIYFIAFLSAYHQAPALIGSRGLLPAPRFLDQLKAHFASSSSISPTQNSWPLISFIKFINNWLEHNQHIYHFPTIFWWTGYHDSNIHLSGNSSSSTSSSFFQMATHVGFDLNTFDDKLRLLCLVGLGLSAFGLVVGPTALSMFLLWATYMSLDNVGQLFWGYGWEMQLLETGFLAIFLCPLFSWNPFPRHTPPSFVLILLNRWLILRIMLGAGLIKLRSSDSCWIDLTCLDYHYETQPIPNPVSWYLHQAPHWFHAFGVWTNHFVELVVPWFAFSRNWNNLAGIFLVAFQVILIISGNLSFLNWLTIVPALACFDDNFLEWILISSRFSPVARFFDLWKKLIFVVFPVGDKNKEKRKKKTLLDWVVKLVFWVPAFFGRWWMHSYQRLQRHLQHDQENNQNNRLQNCLQNLEYIFSENQQSPQMKTTPKISGNKNTSDSKDNKTENSSPKNSKKKRFGPLLGSRSMKKQIKWKLRRFGWGVRAATLFGLTGLILYLSIGPVMNLISPHQAMNRSFDPLKLVNTYGAFGTVGKDRPEIVIKGTNHSHITPQTEWFEYEFKCKPGAVDRRPCIAAPYQHRIDWQIWFAAMSTYEHNPWLVHFVGQLLAGEKAATNLLAVNPFPGAPPRFIKLDLYLYKFTRQFSAKAWWDRKFLREYLMPLSLGETSLRQFLIRHFGWTDDRFPPSLPRHNK
jgi:hypothetical protein